MAAREELASSRPAMALALVAEAMNLSRPATVGGPMTEWQGLVQSQAAQAAQSRVQRDTLNGFGHPIQTEQQSRSIRAAHRGKKELEVEELKKVSPEAGGPAARDEGVEMVLSSPHWRQRGMRYAALLARARSGEGGPAASGCQEVSGVRFGGAAVLEAEAPSSDRQQISRLDSLPSPLLDLTVNNCVPKQGDPLNLWRGKQLTRTEIRVEQKLAHLRTDVMARERLDRRVKQYGFHPSKKKPSAGL